MYHTQGKENPPSLQPFTSMENQVKQMSTMRTSTHLGFVEELSNFSSDGKRLVLADNTDIMEYKLIFFQSILGFNYY